MKLKTILTLLLVCCAHADAGILMANLSITQWSGQQQIYSTEKMLQNMAPARGLPGATIASPEQAVTDYYYHWVRDSALTYMTVHRLYEESSGSQKAMYLRRFLDFVDFSALIQTTSNLGKPKFEVNGQPYTAPWCEPQYDGPALRAITMMAFAQTLTKEGHGDIVRTKILPVLTKDIAIVKSAWRNTSCDLWEEIYGDHFYTRMVQRRAMFEAEKIANLINQDAGSLQSEVQAISAEILKHWDAQKGYFVATLNRTDGLSYKTSNLDASIVLAVLHGYTDDGFLPLLDARVASSVQAVLHGFTFYGVNKTCQGLGPAIGRYPEDVYFGGNPWVLLTAATSQYFYRAYLEAIEKGDKSASLYLVQAEQELARVKYHAPNDGAFAEQIDRNTGYMISARDLTWSHTEVLETLHYRDTIAPKALIGSAIITPQDCADYYTKPRR
jgi:glucoamylase